VIGNAARPKPAPMLIRRREYKFGNSSLLVIIPNESNVGVNTKGRVVVKCRQRRVEGVSTILGCHVVVALVSRQTKTRRAKAFGQHPPQ